MELVGFKAGEKRKDNKKGSLLGLGFQVQLTAFFFAKFLLDHPPILVNDQGRIGLKRYFPRLFRGPSQCNADLRHVFIEDYLLPQTSLCGWKPNAHNMVRWVYP